MGKIIEVEYCAHCPYLKTERNGKGVPETFCLASVKFKVKDLLSTHKLCPLKEVETISKNNLTRSINMKKIIFLTLIAGLLACTCNTLTGLSILTAKSSNILGAEIVVDIESDQYIIPITKLRLDKFLEAHPWLDSFKVDDVYKMYSIKTNIIFKEEKIDIDFWGEVPSGEVYDFIIEVYVSRKSKKYFKECFPVNSIIESNVTVLFRG